MKSGVVIDREAFSPPVLELLLLAEDIGLLNGTADLIVTILDDNDNWPIFNPAALTIHLLENCPPGKRGAGCRPQAGAGWWSVGIGASLAAAEFTFSGRKTGSRMGGESTGQGVRRPRSPSLPFSDPQSLVCKTKSLSHTPG